MSASMRREAPGSRSGALARDGFAPAVDFSRNSGVTSLSQKNHLSRFQTAVFQVQKFRAVEQESFMASFPEKANVVIIGIGGIVGSSVAHHLIAKGWTDIVGVDKSSVPTDIGSTSHASDFCYMTAHDNMTCYTTRYSVEFYDAMGHYSRVGGLEVARHDDDERMAELKRKVSSGRAFGTNVKMISAEETKEKMPLIEQAMVQGAMWDPDAGLVIPRSQTVAGKLVDQAEASGELQVFQNTEATGFKIADGRIQAVETSRGTIAADAVVVCAGLWGRLVAQMAGEDLPIMPVDHPLSFFGPYEEFAGTGKEIGYPLLRDQGNSAYLRDTGDPTTAEGGQIEWVTTKKKIRDWFTPKIYSKKANPTGRPRNVTSSLNRSSNLWSGRWN